MMKRILLSLSLFSICNITFAQELLESVPIVLVDNLIFFQLKVNDSEDLNFMFDSGAGVTVFDSATAQKILLDITSNSRIRTAGKTITAQTSENNQLQIGQMHLDGISLEVIYLEHLSEYFKYKVDGIIGYDLFSRYVIETDIDNMKLNIYNAEGFIYQGQGDVNELIKIEGTGNQIGMNISIAPHNKDENIKLPFKIDTGAANHMTLFNHTVMQYDLIKKKNKYKTNKGFSADKTITSNHQGKVKKVSFGQLDWRNVPVVFTVDEINIAASRESEAYGLLGQKLLLDFNIIYDYAHGLIYLEKRK